MGSPSRRRVLRSIGTVSAGGYVLGTASIAPGRAGGESAPDCSGLREDLEDARATLEQRRDTLAELESTVRSRKRDVMDLHATQQSESGFDQATKDAALELGRTVRESVVVIDVIYDHGTGYGTGWFDDQGRIVTNAHNVDQGWNSMTVLTWQGEEIDATLVGYDDDRDPDVALIETPYDGAPGIEAGSSTDLSVDQPLVQVGHPGGFGYWVISLGGFERRDGPTGDRETADLETSIPGLSGNSGSPIVDMDGTVVGMTYSSESKSSGTGYEPAPATVHTELLAVENTLNAVPIEAVVEKVEGFA